MKFCLHQWFRYVVGREDPVSSRTCAKTWPSPRVHCLGAAPWEPGPVRHVLSPFFPLNFALSNSVANLSLAPPTMCPEIYLCIIGHVTVHGTVHDGDLHKQAVNRLSLPSRCPRRKRRREAHRRSAMAAAAAVDTPAQATSLALHRTTRSRNRSRRRCRRRPSTSRTL
uniref:Uncharacterized protein n=1 Tax=Setaria italica TaxID=4555 RepID=K3ZK26_SETIT